MEKANKEAASLLDAAMFSPQEKSKFISGIKRGLDEKGVILDSLG